jgi:hypothetical protein
MGIETNYEYIYYTVIDTSYWRHGNEEWLGEDGFTWENAIDFINHKLKTSKDKSVNNYRVDYTGYEQDIGDWIRIHERHKERPVFVQFQDNQLIKITGEGSMFVLYEEDDEDTNESITVRHDNRPDEETFIPYHGGVDGLAGAGGRL